MKNKFVEGLSNVARFLEDTRVVEARGSAEASWHLVKGHPGYGKGRTLTWYAQTSGAMFVRAKARWTPHWLLRDLADELGIGHAHSTERLYAAVMPEIMERWNARSSCLIIDEIDHAARHADVLETLRDITDTAEMPLIAIGMNDAERLMRRFPQIHGRIAAVTEFAPATVDDVKLVCKELSNVKIADDLAEAIQKRTSGQMRGVKNAIARVEHYMKNSRDKVTLDMWGKRPLTNEERQAKQLRLVEAA